MSEPAEVEITEPATSSPAKRFQLLQLRNQNALETAKLLTDDLNHYRGRHTRVLMAFSTFCVVAAGSVYAYPQPIRPTIGWLVIFLLVALAAYVGLLLRTNRLRSIHVKLRRQELLSHIELPLDGPFRFSLENGLPGVTRLFWLIIVTLLLVPVVVILLKINVL